MKNINEKMKIYLSVFGIVSGMVICIISLILLTNSMNILNNPSIDTIEVTIKDKWVTNSIAGEVYYFVDVNNNIYEVSNNNSANKYDMLPRTRHKNLKIGNTYKITRYYHTFIERWISLNEKLWCADKTI